MDAAAGRIKPREIPTPAESLALMTAYAMLPNIREHSQMVREVAVHLGTSLVEAGLPLRLDLIEAGALLHDLGKTHCLGTSINHADWGAEALVAAGYPEVAQVVREHVFLDAAREDPRGIREAEVVNYADKRVLHTRVVTLGERFADLRERYGVSPEAKSRIAGLERMAQRLEVKLFAPLRLTPADLLQLNDARRKLCPSCALP
jgi:putative nucleotidyltransferase with HDIG domain